MTAPAWPPNAFPANSAVVRRVCGSAALGMAAAFSQIPVLWVRAVWWGSKVSAVLPKSVFRGRLAVRAWPIEHLNYNAAMRGAPLGLMTDATSHFPRSVLKSTESQAATGRSVIPGTRAVLMTTPSGSAMPSAMVGMPSKSVTERQVKSARAVVV